MAKSFNQYRCDFPSADEVDEVVFQVEMLMAGRAKNPENIAEFTEEVRKRLIDKVSFQLLSR